MRALKTDDALAVPEIKDAYDGVLRPGVCSPR